MKAGRGKAKGNAFERDICKQLSLWVTHGKRDDVLWRSAISGGRATVASKSDKDLAHVSGDVCAVHRLGFAFVDDWYVECKHYRDLGLPRLVTDGSGKLYDFWVIACREAIRHRKQPLLIAKQNQYPVVVCLHESAYQDLFRSREHHGVLLLAAETHIVPFHELLTTSYPR